MEDFSGFLSEEWIWKVKSGKYDWVVIFSHLPFSKVHAVGTERTPLSLCFVTYTIQSQNLLT